LQAKAAAGYDCGTDRENAIMRITRAGLAALALAALAFPAATAGAGEGLFEFEIPNSPEANSIFRLNSATGEINVCYWAKVEGKPIGKIQCDPAGENAGPQRPGVYGILKSPYKTETGVYRFDKLSGKVWLCFSDSGKTVCAAQQ
jgi:hypothetical protein